MLHVFSIGSDVGKMYELKRSANETDFQINFIVPPKWNGFIDKISYMIDAIKDLPERDIVCFIDAYDVLAFGSKDELRQKFVDMNADFVLSAEGNCYPGFLADEFPNLPTRTIYKYINSGTYIGYKFAVMEFLTWKSITEAEQYSKKGTDQYYLACYFMEYYKTKRIILDHDQKIFQVMFGISWHDLKIRDRRIWNFVLDTMPNFVHFNGDSHLTEAEEDVREVINNLIDGGESMSLEHLQPKFNRYGVWRPQLDT